MRIGLFTDTYTPDINGVVSSVVTLQTELEKHGHEVFVITNHKAFLFMHREGNVLRLPGLELKWLYGYKLTTPYHLSARDEVKKMKLDVIHVHTEFGVGMFGRIVANSLNIPIVSTYHTMYEDYTHYINRFGIDEVEVIGKKFITSFSRMISDRVQAVIAPSDKTKEALVNYGVKTPIYVIPTGLNFDKFDPSKIDWERVKEIRRTYGLQAEDHVITFVGRIAKEKSIEIPIEGFQYIKDPHAKLLIVGGGPQLEELKELVKKYRLQDKVIFSGAQSREDVPLFYACADAFVSASLTETQGMTYIEALASHLPVFARPDEVLEDLVLEDKTGYLFHSPQEFAQKFDAYLAMSQEHQMQMKRVARDVVSKYDGNMFYTKVLSVYYQAIDDFEDAYEVLKVKQSDDYVRIYVENEKEDEPLKILITIEDYFLLKIQKGTLLDRNTVLDLMNKERSLEAYRACIRKLRIKDYTKKEMSLYLKQQRILEEDEIAHVIEELMYKGYINDHAYMMMKIDKLAYSLQGKGKVLRSLVEKGIPYDEVVDALSKVVNEDDERDRAFKMAEKLKNSVKDKSMSMKRKVIAQKLMAQGFAGDIAKRVSESLRFEDTDDREALEKTIQKAMRNYSRKHSGKQLKNKVIAYCIQKGFKSEEVLLKVDEMEWNNEQMVE